MIDANGPSFGSGYDITPSPGGPRATLISEQLLPCVPNEPQVEPAPEHVLHSERGEDGILPSRLESFNVEPARDRPVGLASRTTLEGLSDGLGLKGHYFWHRPGLGVTPNVVRQSSSRADHAEAGPRVSVQCGEPILSPISLHDERRVIGGHDAAHHLALSERAVGGQ